MRLRVLLADDQILVRQGVAALLREEGYQVVGEAGDGQAALRLGIDLQPDVLLLEISLPLLNGMDVARQVLKASPNTKAIILTLLKDPMYLLEAFKSGVNGYVLKNQESQDLLHAIREVSRELVYVCPDLSTTVMPLVVARHLPPGPLSPREREIVQLIAEGRTTKEIGSILAISDHTVESHRARIMQKLEAHHLADLVRYAIRNGLVQA